MNVYVLMKRIIDKGEYDKEDMMNKLDTYYLLERITHDQYLELMDLIDPLPEEELPPVV